MYERSLYVEAQMYFVQSSDAGVDGNMYAKGSLDVTYTSCNNKIVLLVLQEVYATSRLLYSFSCTGYAFQYGASTTLGVLNCAFYMATVKVDVIYDERRINSYC